MTEVWAALKKSLDTDDFATISVVLPTMSQTLVDPCTLKISPLLQPLANRYQRVLLEARRRMLDANVSLTFAVGEWPRFCAGRNHRGRSTPHCANPFMLMKFFCFQISFWICPRFPIPTFLNILY